MNNQIPLLYYSPGSCSLAVHIILEEIGKPFNLHKIVTDEGDAKKPEFRQLNPKGRIPVLIEGENILTEAPAILMYLGMSNPEKKLAPATNEEIYKSLEWFNWLSGTVHSIAVRQIWRPEYFSNDASNREAIIARGHQHLTEAHQLIETRLQQDCWALGSRYTILDPFLLVFFRWGNRMNIPMSEVYPVWTKHAEMMINRQAVQRALDSEEISIWE